MFKQSRVAELLYKPQLFLWDEAPMTKTIAIKNLDKLLKDIMEIDKDIGGKMVVFFNNLLNYFCQFGKIIFVAKNEKKIIKEHESRNDPNFSEFLLRVGKYDEPNNTKGNIKIPEDMIIEYDNEKNSILRLIRYNNGMQDFKNNVIDGEIVFGQHIGNLVFIPKVPLSLAENETYLFQFRPQRQTISNIGVYLTNLVSSQYQLYIAISRETLISITNS
ncbi:hypothetical protein Pfo_001888 [Paulownia fortunei]|nr:hypothetical protein Pfo_001888 [Paulownia fortunei]